MKQCVRCGRMSARNFHVVDGEYVCTSETECRDRAEWYAWALPYIETAKRKRAPQPFNGNGLRDSLGATVTMQHRVTGRRKTLHEPGFVRDALRAIVDRFDPAEWYAACISTPRTILADVRVRRTGRGVPRPEESLLSQIGRTEYLPPVVRA